MLFPLYSYGMTSSPLYMGGDGLGLWRCPLHLLAWLSHSLPVRGHSLLGILLFWDDPNPVSLILVFCAILCSVYVRGHAALALLYLLMRWLRSAVLACASSAFNVTCLPPLRSAYSSRVYDIRARRRFAARGSAFLS